MKRRDALQSIAAAGALSARAGLRYWQYLRRSGEGPDAPGSREQEVHLLRGPQDRPGA